MAQVTTLVAQANSRGPTSGFTDVDDDQVQLPKGFDRLNAKLFTPLRVGPFTLSYRIIHAALGRSRSFNGQESPHAAAYFSHRTTPGSLIISQATGVRSEFAAWPFSVELQTEGQIKALQRTIDAVHDKGGIWFQQLTHVGRCSSPSLVKRAHDRAGVPEPYFGYHQVSSWTVQETGINTHSGEQFGVPHALTVGEIKQTVGDFKRTAQNAVKAGADGIEILAGNGFLLDQFLHDNINQRTDEYGGSVENRSRLILEIVDSVADLITYQKIGVRISPFSNFHETDGSQPLEQLLHLGTELAKRGIAYLSVSEARVSRNLAIEENLQRLVSKGIAPEDISLRRFRKALSEIKPNDTGYQPTVLFGNGGYTSATALITVEDNLADGVVFGRRFISNPDLMRRIRYGYPLDKYDRNTFYTHGAKGYITYKNYDGPISDEEKQDSIGINITHDIKELYRNGHIDSSSPRTNGANEPTQNGGNLRKVAIIGAGISGIATASAFQRLGGFELRIFERKAISGGSWSFDEVSSSTPLFPANTPESVDPPLKRPDGALPVVMPRTKQQRFHSTPMYQTIRANIPYNVMSEGSTFSLPTPTAEDFPFLPGSEIYKTVESTARKFEDLITYCTTVENVDKLGNGGLTLLLRRENADGTDTWYEEEFEHLVVATGHNSVPRIPDIPGLQSWTRGLRHSTTWRSGAEFKDQRIIIVGSSESAVDIALQSLPHAKSPIYVSQRTAHPRYPTVFQRPGIEVVPTIDHITETELHLNDGRVLTDVDTIIFATGYFYTYPFLSENIRPKTNGYRVPGVYQHVFDMYNPERVAFIGVVNASLAWATWEKAAFLTALHWTGRIRLPPVEDQRAWEEKRRTETSDRLFHILAKPSERVIYWDDLNELAEDYLNTDAMDDDLLRSFPHEWMMSLAEGHEVKKRYYGLTDV